MAVLSLIAMVALTSASGQTSREVFTVPGLRLSVDKPSGRFSLGWNGNASIHDAYGEVTMSDGSIRRTIDAKDRTVKVRSIANLFGKGIEVSIANKFGDGFTLKHTIALNGSRKEAMVRLEASAQATFATNCIVPLTTEAKVDLKRTGQCFPLFVPYDNDNYFRYNSVGWGEGEGNEHGSYEVGAIYDDLSRNGLIIGSLDHEVWKSAVRFFKDGGVRAVAGVTSKYTHDKESHGSVSGKTVSSPRFVVGCYGDWRDGLERYGDLNAIVKPPLVWHGGAPFGWNSWSGHKNKITNIAALTALEFVKSELPLLRNDGIAYVNLDSFWDNMTPAQLSEFCRQAHAAGLKAGIYWSPFVNWGEPDWKTSGGYHFGDIQLKDSKGQFLPKLDGGWPLDPTHPGTLKRIDEHLKLFLSQGFDYIKLDFMTHGALEGRHYNKKLTTGNAAYAFGMKYIAGKLSLERVKRPIFISLSIAPMFPQGYAHSRRISCDVFSNIGASEYLLNSQNYGWWTAGRLYRFNDPDSACVYQALGEDPTTEAEARTRFTASVIGGGMMIEGDDLTNPKARDRVEKLFSNKDVLQLASRAPSFRPVRGDTNDAAGDAYIHHLNPDEAYVALFNFSKKDMKRTSIPLLRLDLPEGKWQARELWTGRTFVVSGSLAAELLPMDCALLQLTRLP